MSYVPGHGHNAVGKKVVLVEAISKCHLTNSYYVRVDILKLEKVSKFAYCRYSGNIFDS